ncbi:MAG: DUF2905 domain-containing protein [Candidatus Omnitrophota bacterium]
MGRLLIFAGVVLIVVGVIVLFSERIPGIGRLPGDILIKREHFTFYLPLTTSLLLSLIVSLLLMAFHKKSP